MKAEQMIADLRCIARQLPRESQGASMLFKYLADNVCMARLNNGSRILDSIDFSNWLRELAEAARVPSRTLQITKQPVRTCSGVTRRGAIEQLHEVCPRCAHVHQGVVACGKDMGDGRICRCELPVPA